MPKVSVIIPTYNREKLITKTVESVLAQTYKDYEIIIVDDGSTDQTKEALKPYLSQSHIHYLYQKNQKQAKARNTGIKHSVGENIAFLDSDDLWDPKKLELQVEVLEEKPRIGMVYSNQSIMANDFHQEKQKYPPGILRSGFIFKDLLLRKYYCSTPTILVRRTVLDDVGLLDESLMNALEDWELTLRISKKYEVYCVDKPLVRRRLHEGIPYNYYELRINNLQKILIKNLENSDLSPSFRKIVWAKTFFGCGHAYLEKNRFAKAFWCFVKAFKKGHWAGGVAAMLCLLGPFGKMLFVRIFRFKYKGS